MKINLVVEKLITKGGVKACVEDAINLLSGDGIVIEINSREKCNVMGAHTVGFRYLYNAWKYRKRSVVHAHTIPRTLLGRVMFARLWSSLIVPYMKFVYNIATVVVAVSPSVKRELEKIGVKSKIVVVPNGVDRKKFSRDVNKRNEFRKKYNIGKEEFMVLGVGMTQPVKGIKTFCEVAGKLPDHKFVWVGGNELGWPSAGKLGMKRLIKQAPANVIFTGHFFQDRGAGVDSAYCAADVFFFPSFQETFGKVIIEACSCGLPVVLRDIEEYKDLFFDCYLKGITTGDFVRLIISLKSDRNLFDEYKTRAGKLADLYNVENYKDRMIDIYRSVVG